MKLKIELPDGDGITRGLTLREVHPPLGAAEQAEADHVRQLEDARRRLTEAEANAAQLARNVAAGRATVDDLEAALSHRRACALTIPHHEAALEAAGVRVKLEREQAARTLRAEVERRQLPLLDVAARVAPLLARVNELDQALEAALEREFIGPTGHHPAALPKAEWPAPWFA